MANPSTPLAVQASEFVAENSAEQVHTAEEDLRAARDIAVAKVAIERELGRRIVGQHDVIAQLLIALFARGHCLFVGVPGLAKTLLISSLAETLALGFGRIQFTPDLMPSDITGTDVLEENPETGQRHFRFLPGPLFANLVLADEINRTPPKTQSALLQAMQEYQVTAGGRTYQLAQPFLVFATQNPIEQEGTYPLPEAQLDRFMFHVDVGYPTSAEELAIVRQETSDNDIKLSAVLSPEKLVYLQGVILRVPAADHVLKFAVELVRRTRPAEESALPAIKQYVTWGAGPRASKNLILAAKTRAILNGRFAASTEDVKAVAQPVLAHRMVLNYRAVAEKVTTRDLIVRLLESLT